MRRIAPLACAALLAAAASLVATGSGAAAAAQAEELLLRGATVVDGTGAPAYAADVLVRGQRIVAVAAPGTLEAAAGTDVQELSGLVLAPGFIDIHNHSTGRFARDPLATTQIAQGVTTVMVGADGSSPWPIDEFLHGIEQLRPAVNVGVFVGHGTVRSRVLGEDFRRAATAGEIEAMASLVEQGMRAGAFGLSSGLEYDPGFYSTTEELIALARVAGRHGGIYMSHIRDEEEGVLDAIAEAIRIGERAHLPVQISHIKMGNASVWGRARDALALIDAARARGLDVTADQYPYTAWESGLGIIVRSRRFTDPEEVAAGLADAGGGERLQIIDYEADPSVNGMRLSEIAARAGKSEVDMYIEIMRNGGSGVIGHTMSDEDVDAFMRHPAVMTASDGGIGSAHPRGAGAFARVLATYVRERELLSLERAVQRGTFMPAAKLRLRDRGVIRPGAIADLVAFDPATVTDRSTFSDPFVPAAGVARTWVAGQLVWRDGAATGARPGRALRRADAR